MIYSTVKQKSKTPRTKHIKETETDFLFVPLKFSLSFPIT